MKWMRFSIFPLNAAALRGAATLKARALKDVWSIGAAAPAAEKGTTVMTTSGCSSDYHEHSHGNGFVEGLALEDDFLDSCHQQLLARGTELLKRTRKGGATDIEPYSSCIWRWIRKY